MIYHAFQLKQESIEEKFIPAIEKDLMDSLTARAT
jgi:hypothetical protein